MQNTDEGIASLTTGSCPDGDFTEDDLKAPSRGAVRVSLKLLPYDAVLRVNPCSDGAASAVDDESKFVRFKHYAPQKGSTHSSLFCLHEYAILTTNSNNNKSNKKNKQRCTKVFSIPVSAVAAGGANISTLRSHVNAKL